MSIRWACPKLTNLDKPAQFRLASVHQGMVLGTGDLKVILVLGKDTVPDYVEPLKN